MTQRGRISRENNIQRRKQRCWQWWIQRHNERDVSRLSKHERMSEI